MEEVIDFVVEVYSNEVGLDEILLHLVPAARTEECDHRIRAYLQARLRVSPHIVYTDAAGMQKMQFPEASRKAIKFLDRRNEFK
jgi:phenylacetate-CoA ligase